MDGSEMVRRIGRVNGCLRRAPPAAALFLSRVVMLTNQKRERDWINFFVNEDGPSARPAVTAVY